MKRFGALFDLDGVIIDSECRYTIFWNEIERLYPTGIENYAVAIKGTTLPVILNNYRSESVKSDITRRLMEFQAHMPFEAFPGAIEFLNMLKRSGIPAALVTSSDEQKVERLFEALPQLCDKFVTVIDGSMVSRSKPDPEGYIRAAKSLGFEPEECIVFEDSLQGLAAGRASGAKIVGLSTTYPVSQLEGKADLIVGALANISLSDLETLVENE